MAYNNYMTAKEVLKIAKQQGFEIVRQKGSHVRLAHKDGRKTTVPMHHGDLKPGTLNAILKDIGVK